MNIGPYNLLFNSSSATWNGTVSSTCMIEADSTGYVQKVFATGASSFTFPIGDNESGANYSPTTLSFTGNSVQRTIGVNVKDKIILTCHHL